MDKNLNEEVSRDDFADVTGEVVVADLPRRQFQLLRQPETAVCVPFEEGQEDIVTTALKNHKWTQLRVQGRGEYSSAGKLLRITQVERMELLPEEGEFDPSAPAIEDILLAIAAKIPDSEWDKLPRDLSGQVDHYLYGARKRANP